jgi:Spy/CpxP family protein refolding chaperone
MTLKWLAAPAVVCLMVSGAAFAQSAAAPATGAQGASAAITDDDIKSLRADLRAGKKQIIAENLPLTADEATKFWPVYDQFTNELSSNNNAKYEMLKEYANRFGTYNDAQALDLAKRSLDLDVRNAQLRQAYLKRFAAVLPGVKVAAFYQIERRVQLIIDMQLASALPMMQNQGALKK